MNTWQIIQLPVILLIGQRGEKVKKSIPPDLKKVLRWREVVKTSHEDTDEFIRLHEVARQYLMSFKWCSEILDEYAGMLCAGIVGMFLFHIRPAREDVDEWIWIVVGDVPPAYLTCDQCPNPATALDGYIGAMTEWVEAVEKGKSVAKIIPVNVPATRENAKDLQARLKFLDEKIVVEYQDDLR